MTKEQADTIHHGAHVRYNNRDAIVASVKVRGMYPPYFTLVYDDAQGGGEDWTSYMIVGTRDA